MTAMPTVTPHVHGQTVRVVTVDDQPIFRRAAAAIIESTPGFELVGESADAEAALELIPALDPDLVIVDVRMPGVDGIELARRLHAADPGRTVVLATSVDPRALSRLAGASGAAALVHKHWLSPRLLRGLWIVLRQR
jgi:two-component system invasion response regulator UvrY